VAGLEMFPLIDGDLLAGICIFVWWNMDMDPDTLVPRFEVMLSLCYIL
jgi:hypothetical protein